jgi:histone-lysine N-methyltransferase SETMAR
MKIHMGNSRIHSTLETEDKVCKAKMERLAHPPYSANLSPCAFEFSGRAKTALRNRRFVDSDDVIEVLANLFDIVSLHELQRVFQSWIQRLEWVIRNNGEYFTERLNKVL